MKKNTILFYYCFFVLFILTLLSPICNQRSFIFDYSLYADTLIYWEPEQRLTYDSIGQVDCQVWAYDSFVHILVNYDFPLMYLRSSDYGETWSDTTRVNIRNSNHLQSLIQQDSVVYFVWSEQWPGPPVIARVDTSYAFFRRSNDYGVTLDSALFLGKGCYVSIDAKGESVFVTPVVWDPPPVWGPYFIYSFDGGFNWSEYLPVTDSSSQANIAYRNGVLHYAGWRDYSIIYTRSADLGTTWTTPTIITAPNTHLPKRPNLALGPNQNVYIAWTDNKFGGGMLFDDVMFRKSTDDGLTWGVEQRLTPDSHCDAGGALDMVSQDSLIFIVWNYIGLGSPTPCSLFFLASTECGNTWLPRETVKEGSNIGAICDANVAVVQDYVYVIWRDNQYGPTDEVSMRRGSFTPPGIEERTPLSVSSLNISPNPFTTSITIALPSIGHRAKGIELKIYDITGKEMMSYALSYRENGISVDTRDLPVGIYFIKFTAGRVSTIKKVVKIK